MLSWIVHVDRPTIPTLGYSTLLTNEVGDFSNASNVVKLDLVEKNSSKESER